jgi:putative membrane protein insertion efficiency factor
MIRDAAKVLARALAILLGALLRVYQLTISPSLGPTCRFEPSCSEYMRQAVERYGFFHGLARGLRRLLRCHPFCAGGWDPVR